MSRRDAVEYCGLSIGATLISVSLIAYFIFFGVPGLDI